MKKNVIKIVLFSTVFGMLVTACNSVTINSSSNSSSSSSAHEHTFASEWNYDQEYHWHNATCEHENEVSGKEAHNFVKGETIAPTKEAKGYTVYTCSVCNYSKNDDYTDPVDSYKGRIKNKDFKIINISYERQNANDPRFFEDSKPLSTYLKPDTYKLYYLDEINDVYYLPLSTYADLFKGDFKDGVVNTIKEENGISTWTSTFNDNTYTLSIDKEKETISVIGSLEESFKTVPNGRNGVYDQGSFTTTYVEGHEEKVKTFSFKEYGFDIFEVDGKTCYPFALLAAETSKYVERKFLNASYYNYLLEYNTPEQYAEFMFLDDENKEVQVSSLVTDSFEKLYGVKNKSGDIVVTAPQSLTEFNKKIIYYLFNNYYGLATVKGIKSMSDYFDNLEESGKYFTDSNSVNRGSGYYRALQGLNDLHTSYGYSGFMGEGASENAIVAQSFYKDRSNLNGLLGSLREREIEKYNSEKSLEVTAKNVRYSDDGKYAYFSFDSFDTYTYFEEGEIPENELFYDSYHQFVKNLNEIKAKGTVKRVFIDDSLNGGGYVAIMGKLLALMSKDNKSVMYLHDETDDAIQQITTRVDSNKDGKYDEKDCFGNDFAFYVITSSYSFSCGNAFPFYADKCDLAKVIGIQSGGGECCVFNHTLPTGQSITYSSPYHIGQYYKDTNKFIGDEDGIYPYITPNKSINLYDVNSLAEFVTARQPF